MPGGVSLPVGRVGPTATDPMSSFTKPPAKSRHRWFIGVMLGIVLLGGVANLIFTTGNHPADEEVEEYQIVDITVAPPPPPPPPEEETMEEPEELEESVEPLEMAANDENPPEDSSELDLGIDIGDLAASAGSGFAMDIPRFGRGSLGGGDDDEMTITTTATTTTTKTATSPTTTTTTTATMSLSSTTIMTTKTL